ncbi:MAG: Holliday junction branch migration DNA helicase RuvB, partial [Polyangiaceae bacterium]|nr:Holliday junction branch migration DNA helicase RuvB [Polyangiaceae bacterium]
MASKDRSDPILSAVPATEEKVYEISLRPSRFDDFVGQDKIKENLRVFVEAARRR